MRDLDQRTPLHIALMTNNLKSAVHLIDGGADLNLCDYRGNTALHMVISLQDRHSLKDHIWYAFAMKRFIGKKMLLRMDNKEVVKKVLSSILNSILL